MNETSRLVGPWEPAPTEPPASLERSPDAPTEVGAETTHRSPLPLSGVMPCCGRTPFEAALGDRMTVDDALVTCRGLWEPAEQSEGSDRRA